MSWWVEMYLNMEQKTKDQTKCKFGENKERSANADIYFYDERGSFNYT